MAGSQRDARTAAYDAARERMVAPVFADGGGCERSIARMTRRTGLPSASRGRLPAATPARTPRAAHASPGTHRASGRRPGSSARACGDGSASRSCAGARLHTTVAGRSSPPRWLARRDHDSIADRRPAVNFLFRACRLSVIRISQCLPVAAAQGIGSALAVRIIVAAI